MDISVAHVAKPGAFPVGMPGPNIAGAFAEATGTPGPSMAGAGAQATGTSSPYRAEIAPYSFPRICLTDIAAMQVSG